MEAARGGWPVPAGRIKTGFIVLITLILGTSFACRVEEPARRSDRPVSTAVSRKVAATPPEKKYEPPPPPPPPTWRDYDRAVEQYNDGEYESVLDLLDRIARSGLEPEQGRRLHFLAGASAYRAGRFEEVETYLAGEGRVPASLEGHALYLRGMARFGAGRYAEARDLLAAALDRLPGAAWAGRVRLIRAEALYYQGRPEEAIKEAQGLLKKEAAGEVRLALARMYEGQGDLVRARDYYREAMDSSDRCEVRSVAALEYEQLLAPVIGVEGRENEKLELVRFLRQGWRLDEALALIEALDAQGGGVGFREALEAEKALLLYFSGRDAEALAYYQGSGSATGRRMYARCLRRLGRWEEAAQAYLAAAQGFGGSRAGDEARFDAGVCLLRAEKPQAAEAAFSLLGQGRFKDDLLWTWGFHYYRQKEWDKAAERFAALVKELPRSGLARRAEYWLGRAHERAGRKEEAWEQYMKLAGEGKDPYYRMLAERRLGVARKFDHWPDLPLFRDLLASREAGRASSFLPLLANGTSA
ncbi:MAG: tetratricopeptide repeat protein, partial [Thermodesulfobacteriota bacterium]